MYHYYSIELSFLRFAKPPGGTQIWMGYGCPARTFDHYPITKPEEMQIYSLYLNQMFLEGPFSKPISTF